METRGNTLLNAVIGAVVTIVFSFLGISPLLGGGLAGYLQKTDGVGGAKVGAISGAIASIPGVLIALVLMFVFGLAGLGSGDAGGIGFGIASGVFILIIVLAALVYTAGLSAIGGFVGAYIYKETSDGDSRGAGTATGGTVESDADLRDDDLQ